MEGLCCVTFSFNKSVEISAEQSKFVSFLELAPSNFWVDQPQEISSDVAALKRMPELLVPLTFFKKKSCLDYAKYCSLADLYLTDSDEGHLCRGVPFLCVSY